MHKPPIQTAIRTTFPAFVLAVIEDILCHQNAVLRSLGMRPSHVARTVQRILPEFLQILWNIQPYTFCTPVTGNDGRKEDKGTNFSIQNPSPIAPGLKRTSLLSASAAVRLTTAF